MIGMNTGQAMVSVGVAMVLQDQFTNQANNIGKAYRSMMEEIYSSSGAPRGLTELLWSRGASGLALSAMGGLIDSYTYFADVQNDLFWATKMTNGGLEEQNALMEEVRKVNLVTPLTNKDLSSAARFMAMAGNTNEAIQQMLEPVAQLSGVFGMQAGGKGGVADLFTNISMMFGRNLEDQQEAYAVANELYAVTTSSNTNLQDLAQAITYSGSEMRRAGYGLKETAASIGAMGNYGIQGSSAGTALANMIRYLQLSASGQKQKGSDMLKAVGIDAKSLMDSEGHLISLNEIYHKMYEATKDLDTFSKNQFFYNVFGVRGTREIAAMTQMIEDAAEGASKYEEIIQRMYQASKGNELGGAYKEWIEDPAGQLAMFNAELDNIRTTLGQQIAPLFTPILHSINSVLGSIGWLAGTGLGGVLIRGLAISTAFQLVVRGVVALVGLLRTTTSLASSLQIRSQGLYSGPAKANAQFAVMEMHLRTILLMLNEIMVKNGLIAGQNTMTVLGSTGKPHQYTAAQYTNISRRMAGGATGVIGGATGGAATRQAINNGTRTIASGFTRLLGWLGGPWGMALFTLGPIIGEGIKELISKQDEEIQTLKETLDQDRLNQREQEILKEILKEATQEGILTGMSQVKLNVEVPDSGQSYNPTFLFGVDPNNQLSIW